MILFWQFTIKTLNELEIVSNQNLSIEMFLLRLIYLKEVKENKTLKENTQSHEQNEKVKTQEILNENNPNPNKTINQIKNISATWTVSGNISVIKAR